MDSVRKGALLFCFIVAAFQGTNGFKKYSEKSTAGLKENLVVDGREYLVSAGATFLQDAMLECGNAGKNLVSFDVDGEYLSVLKGLRDMGHANWWFWTSGQKNEGSEQWYWSSTGENIIRSYWIPGNPSEDNNVTACMSFNVQQGGWDDDICESNLVLGYICEPTD